MILAGQPVTTTGGAWTNQPYWIGFPAVGGSNNQPTTASAGFAQFMYIHLIWGGSPGAAVCLSMNRTQPNAAGLSGYTSTRRIGSILVSSGYSITTPSAPAYSPAFYVIPFRQFGSGTDRSLWFEVAQGTWGTQVLSGGAALSWTVVACNMIVPPNTVAIWMQVFTQQNGSGTYLRSHSTGDMTPTRNIFGFASSIGGGIMVVACPCDYAQNIDYAISASGASARIQVIGYMESLLW
jgi:hypothetical protein